MAIMKVDRRHQINLNNTQSVRSISLQDPDDWTIVAGRNVVRSKTKQTRISSINMRPSPTSASSDHDDDQRRSSIEQKPSICKYYSNQKNPSNDLKYRIKSLLSQPIAIYLSFLLFILAVNLPTTIEAHHSHIKSGSPTRIINSKAYQNHHLHRSDDSADLFRVPSFQSPISTPARIQYLETAESRQGQQASSVVPAPLQLVDDIDGVASDSLASSSDDSEGPSLTDGDDQANNEGSLINDEHRASYHHDQQQQPSSSTGERDDNDETTAENNSQEATPIERDMLMNHHTSQLKAMHDLFERRQLTHNGQSHHSPMQSSQELNPISIGLDPNSPFSLPPFPVSPGEAGPPPPLAHPKAHLGDADQGMGPALPFGLNPLPHLMGFQNGGFQGPQRGDQSAHANHHAAVAPNGGEPAESGAGGGQKVWPKIFRFTDGRINLSDFEKQKKIRLSNKNQHNGENYIESAPVMFDGRPLKRKSFLILHGGIFSS